MARFHPLKIAAIRPETLEAVSVVFAVPPELQSEFAFAPGQYLTLRGNSAGQDIRRCYSICSAADDGELRVAIKKVSDGRFSAFANDHWKAGDVVEVMTPEGRFIAPTASAHKRRYVAFAAGSGITPILSLARTLLMREPASHFQLFYGNRSVDTIMFREALEDLKNSFMTRFAVTHILSREKQDFDLFNGRLDGAKIEQLAGKLFDPTGVDLFFLCGPGSLIEEVSGALAKLGVERERIKFELFATPEQPARPLARTAQAAKREGTAQVTVIRDGVRHHFPVAFDGEAILDAGIRQGVDLPFSCKGGVCSTCRCKARLGQVEMDKNYALEPWELDAGFVLACQSHPLSDEVVLDFDEA